MVATPEPASVEDRVMVWLSACQLMSELSVVAGAVVSPGGGGFVISTPVEPVQAVGEAPLKSSDT